MLHVSMHLCHLQGVFSFYSAKVIKIIKVTNSIKQYIKMLTYVTVTVDDKIRSVKRCELSAVSCCTSNYSTWKLLLAWWLYIHSGLSCRCDSYVGVSCMRVRNHNDFYNISKVKG